MTQWIRRKYRQDAGTTMLHADKQVPSRPPLDKRRHSCPKSCATRRHSETSDAKNNRPGSTGRI
eukprot:12916797-Prorocentrum_lima.AAC.1